MACNEIESFVLKFKNLLLAGKNACLTMKSKDGKAFATLQLQLGDPPPTPPLASPHHHPRRQGPSRLKRIAR